MNPTTLPANLSPMEITGAAAMAWTWVTAFAPRLLAAVVILVIGFLVAGWVRRGLDRVTLRTRWVDNTIRPFILGIAQYGVVILVLILVLNQIGIETSSLLAILGAAGLAVGLALQGTLSNIAAGIMLLWLRPFQVGDYIEVNGLAGTIEETGLFACVLRTFDGVRLFAPNSTIWNFALRNHSETGGRLLALAITLSSTVSRESVAAALDGLAAKDERFRKDAEQVLFAEAMTAAGVTLTWRVWVAAGSYSQLQRSIVDLVRAALRQSGIPDDAVQSIARTTPVPGDPTRLMNI